MGQPYPMQKSEAIVRAKYPEAVGGTVLTRSGLRYVVYSSSTAGAFRLSSRHGCERQAWNRAARNVLATS